MAASPGRTYLPRDVKIAGTSILDTSSPTPCRPSKVVCPPPPPVIPPLPRALSASSSRLSASPPAPFRLPRSSVRLTLPSVCPPASLCLCRLLVQNAPDQSGSPGAPARLPPNPECGNGRARFPPPPQAIHWCDRFPFRQSQSFSPPPTASSLPLTCQSFPPTPYVPSRATAHQQSLPSAPTLPAFFVSRAPCPLCHCTYSIGPYAVCARPSLPTLTALCPPFSPTSVGTVSAPSVHIVNRHVRALCAPLSAHLVGAVRVLSPRSVGRVRASVCTLPFPSQRLPARARPLRCVLPPALRPCPSALSRSPSTPPPFRPPFCSPRHGLRRGPPDPAVY